MARIPDGFIDSLLARSDIVEVVGNRIPLKKQGKEFAARCPFHDERSASFTVSPTKQFYHCFGCGAHGSAITFLMQYDRLEFLDAVEELAKHVGMEIPRDAQPQRGSEDSQDIYAALNASAQFYQKQLTQNSTAQNYLQQRDISPEIVQQFAIGYAPEGYSSLKDALATNPRRTQLLEKAGLFSKTDNQRFYDKFRHRLMFPIHDRRGRVIAFGGRVLNPDDSPKYLNSPETVLFHKGKELYGLWQVRQANAKIERLIVVEGYMDVVALFQFGVPQAVATLGTATSLEHAELLFRNAPDVYFCFDGDNAGKKAAWRAVESVLPRMRDGRQAYFLFLPDGEDPDSIVRKEGKSGIDARLQQAMPLSDFFFAELGRDIQLSSLDGRARLAERARPLLTQIPEGAFADLMQQELIKLTGVSQTASVQKSKPIIKNTPTLKRSLGEHIIALLLQKPSLAEVISPPYYFVELNQPELYLLKELLETIKQRSDINTGMLLEKFSTHSDVEILQQLAFQTIPGDESVWENEVADAVLQLEKQTIQQRIDLLLKKQRKQGLDETDKYELRELLILLKT